MITQLLTGGQLNLSALHCYLCKPNSSVFHRFHHSHFERNSSPPPTLCFFSFVFKLDSATPVSGTGLPIANDSLSQHFNSFPITRDTLRTLSQRLNQSTEAEGDAPVKTDPLTSPFLLSANFLPISPKALSSSSSDSSFSEKITPFKFLLSSPRTVKKTFPENTRLSVFTYNEMSSLLKMRTFRGTGDGSEDLNNYLEDIECAAEAFEYQKNSTSIDGIEKSQKRFFRHYLSKDGDASYWWQYVLCTEDKKHYSAIKERFLERYGTTSTAVMSKFEVQSENMALRQNPGESIASFIRNAEKLSKRVPAELDSVLALCLIKGMTDELQKADICYIVNATPDTSFRKVVEIIKATYHVIGKPDPFSKVAESHKSTHTGRWGAYIAPSSGNNVIPVVAAAGRMNTLPSNNVPVDHRMGSSPVEEESRAKNIYGERNLAAALEGCGISPDQLKGLVDWYLQDSSGNAAGPVQQEPQTSPTGANRQQDFQQPALQPPRVTIPAQGVNRRTGVVGTLPANQWGRANYERVSLGVSCFSCGRRGHYSMSCPYPPLPPGEQEKLREAARISRRQRAGLPIPVNHQTAVHARRSHDQGHIIEGIAPPEPPIASGMPKQQQNEIPVETIATQAPLHNDSRISSACAIISR